MLKEDKSYPLAHISFLIAEEMGYVDDVMAFLEREREAGGVM